MGGVDDGANRVDVDLKMMIWKALQENNMIFPVVAARSANFKSRLIRSFIGLNQADDRLAGGSEVIAMIKRGSYLVIDRIFITIRLT